MVPQQKIMKRKVQKEEVRVDIVQQRRPPPPPPSGAAPILLLGEEVLSDANTDNTAADTV